jgi:hypothetical protein
MDALRVDTAHDVANGPVFASRVHRLEAEHQAIAVLGGESLLVLGQKLAAVPEERLSVLLFHGVRSIGRIEVSGQAHQ